MGRLTLLGSARRSARRLRAARSTRRGWTLRRRAPCASAGRLCRHLRTSPSPRPTGRRPRRGAPSARRWPRRSRGSRPWTQRRNLSARNFLEIASARSSCAESWAFSRPVGGTPAAAPPPLRRQQQQRAGRRGQQRRSAYSCGGPSVPLAGRGAHAQHTVGRRPATSTYRS